VANGQRSTLDTAWARARCFSRKGPANISGPMQPTAIPRSSPIDTLSYLRSSTPRAEGTSATGTRTLQVRNCSAASLQIRVLSVRIRGSPRLSVVSRLCSKLPHSAFIVQRSSIILPHPLFPALPHRGLIPLLNLRDRRGRMVVHAPPKCARRARCERIFDRIRFVATYCTATCCWLCASRTRPKKGADPCARSVAPSK